MFNQASLLAAIIPFDPSIDTPLGHRNLVAIYVVVWAVQFAYGLYAFRAYRIGSKSRRR